MESAAPPSRAFSSLHTHSHFDDGNGSIADYARAAGGVGLFAYGASGHAPLPFPCPYAIPLARLDEYRAEVERARAHPPDELSILLGLELDYLPGFEEFYRREFLDRRFDYYVASVHYVGEPGAEPWTYDESAEAFDREVRARHGGNARRVVEDYYQRLMRMVDEVSTWDVPVIVGHLDRVALWNRGDRYFPTESRWYLEVVDEALDAIARSGLVMELNTSGWIKAARAPNPNAPILRRAAERGIPVIVSADAHLPANVALHFDDAAELLAAAGYHEIVVPDPSGWRRAPLPLIP